MAAVPTAPAQPEELTQRELRFVAEYVADPRSATRAYQRAFDLPYTNLSAKVLAHRLLTKVNVQRAIEEHRKEWCKTHRIKFQTIVRKLASIALGDADDYYEADPENGDLPKPRPWNHIPPTARKNIKSIKFKRKKLKSAKGEDCATELEELEYKVADQQWALDKLCEYLGITKGSLTVDELRNILAGTDGTQAPQNPPAPASTSTAQPDTDKPVVIDEQLDPDE